MRVGLEYMLVVLWGLIGVYVVCCTAIALGAPPPRNAAAAAIRALTDSLLR